MAHMKNHRLWLIFIILAGLALRLLWLGRQSLWYDEGVTWLLAQMPLPGLVQWTAADIQPPLYYLLMWAARLLWGSSEWALRFPAALAGTLAIPLLYALGRRLLANRLGPLLAAALLAGSPVMVYYSQEARMYTLLVFEALLTGYLLLKILRPRPCRLRPEPNSIFYGITAAAALYTHYFAAFLLLAHGLYAALVWWRQRRFDRALLAQLLWSFGGALLLFAPWLPILLARLGDDPSYWAGALKLNEAVRKLLISFTTGETVLEQIGWWLALIYLAGLLLAGLGAALNRRTATRQRLTPNSQLPTPYSFLLLWLLLPPALILLLTTWSPKFNPRYTLLSWPALALLTAAALSKLMATQRPAARWLAAGLLALAAGISAFSLANWFTDPRFAKADFKALAQFVRERQSADETVLLSSGHMFPVWAYYYGWDGWTPLPEMLRLDVSRVTTLDIAGQIAEAVRHKSGVWLVTWQAEVIDPTGAVPFWLDCIGQRPHDAGDFWGVGLEHWRLNPAHLNRLTQNPIAQPLTANFNNQLDLVGFTQLSDTELALFWQPRQPLPEKLALTLRLTAADGFYWDAAPGAIPLGPATYPPNRWPVGQTIITRHRLPWLPASPPGQYTAEIGVGAVNGQNYTGWDVLDGQGRPQRRTALANPIRLNQLMPPPADSLPAAAPLLEISPALSLRRQNLSASQAQPGDRLQLALLWQAGPRRPTDISVAVGLRDAAGQSFNVSAATALNLSRRQPGDQVLGQYGLAIPPAAAPGPAQLSLHLISAGQPDQIFPLAGLEILPTERNFTPPAAVDLPLNANFSGQATLIGADCPRHCAAAPGEAIQLTLHWRADAPMATAYTVFAHLLGPNETVLLNADHAPPKATTGWVPGEIIADPVTLNLPANLPPGQYALELGLYNAADPAFARLPLANGATRLLLPGPVRVP